MLPLPKFAYRNLLDSTSTTVTASTAAVGFPATQVQNYLRALRWRATGKTSEFLKVDLGSSQTFNTLIVWDGNFTTAATITVQISSDDVTYQTVVTPVPEVAGQLVLQGPEYTARYVKFNFGDTSIAETYIEIGRVFVGMYLEAEVHPDLGQPERRNSYSIKSRTPGGVVHVLVQPQTISRVLSFSLISPAMRTAFETLVETADQWMPMWITLSNDNVNAPKTRYVLLDQELSTFLIQDCDLHAFSLAYEEVV